MLRAVVVSLKGSQIIHFIFFTHIVNSSSKGPLEESLALAVMLTLATVLQRNATLAWSVSERRSAF